MGLSRSGDRCTAASVRIIAQEKSCWRALWRVSAGRRTRAIGGDPHQPGSSPPQPFCYAVLARPLSIQFVRGAFQSVVPMGATRAMYSALARALQQLMQVSRQLTHAVHRKHGAVIHSSAAYAVGVVQICWLRRGINLCMRGRGAPAALLSCLFVVARNGQ